MELGCDGVLMNTAIAGARDPVMMASAMKKGIEAGREAYRAGRASFLSVLEAQRFFLETRSEYVSVAQSAATAVPALESAIGLPFSRIMGEVNLESTQGTEAEESVEP